MQDLDTIAAKLKLAQSHIVAGRYQEAFIPLQEILVLAPDNVDALYMCAVTHRYARQFDKAEETINQLLAKAPDYGRAYQEKGHLLRDNGDMDGALKAYRQACQTNPALEASWRAQADIVQARGDHAQASQLSEQARRLAKLPKELFAITNLLHEGKLLKAEKLCRAYLQKHRQDVEGMRLLAEIAVRFGVMDDAEFLLESATEFEPDNVQARLDYIQVLRKRQKHEQALSQSKQLIDRDPDNLLFQSQYAVQNMHTGDFDLALKMFDTVLAQLPDDTATLTSKGHALKTYGRREEAVKAYRAAYAADPAHGDAYYSLANLKTYQFTEQELDLMLKQADGDDLTYQGQIHINFALGKAFEDRGDYEKSFLHYSKGNNLKLIQCKYDADQMSAELAAQAKTCTHDLFSAQNARGYGAPDPIFIVGLPRAGSTLLEQILASHSQVEGTLELPNILSLSHRLRRGRPINDPQGYPQILHHLTGDQLHKFGETYINDTRIHRTGAAFFIDKMPNNFRHIGLIHLILPNAKIIDARREPMDCCFSGFKQLFAEGQEFSYGLEQIGRYYKDYVDMMAHWDSVLSGKILRVQYENVVADLENQVRRILDYCDLPFETSCIEFHKTDRAVRTASSEQVRQPINTKGVDAWRPFEPWLGPLKDALGDKRQNYSQ